MPVARKYLQTDATQSVQKVLKGKMRVEIVIFKGKHLHLPKVNTRHSQTQRKNPFLASKAQAHFRGGVKA